MSARFKAVLFDVDGTLVDSNNAHAYAWVRAFADQGVQVDPIEVRLSIGMGGDKLMPAVSGIEEDSPVGRQIAARRGEIFATECLPRLQPFPSADRLIAAIVKRGYKAVAASSAQREELSALLQVAGAASLMDDWTSSDDADASKPEPDIIHAALRRVRVEPRAAVMIGDTPYDVAAARRAGVAMIAFRCGGWLDPDLVGAVEIYDGPADLLARLDRSLLA
jgi:beta-phosphoglucomutase-like phosphatase (HAD superfamily)